LIQRLKQNSFIKYNVTYFAANIIVGVLNYLYHFTVGRILGPSEYSIVAALISLQYILQIPTVAITTISMKFSSTLKAQDRLDQISALLDRLSVYFFFCSLFVFLVFAAMSNQIAKFLNVSSPSAVVILGATFLVAFLIPLNRGIMQGLQNFWSLSINLIVEAFLKLVFACLFVVLGFKALGAIAALPIALLIAYGQSFLPLKKYIKRVVLEIPLRSLMHYSSAIFLAILGITFLQHTDVILVKHFFTSKQAGIYSAAAVMGRTIYLITLPIAGVMFPMVSERHEKNEKHHHLLTFSLILGMGIAGLILLVYTFLPKLAISIMYGQKYISASPYLVWFGVAGTLLSLSSILINYFLAIGNKSFLLFLLTLTMLEAILIFFLHTTLLQVVKIVVCSLAVLLLSLICIYAKVHKERVLG